MENIVSHDLIENRTISPIMTIEGKPMEITATELKKNLGKYLELASKEDIAITKNGKVIAVLKTPDDVTAKLAWLDSIVGAANPDGKEITDDDLKKWKEERVISKYEDLG